MANEVAWLLGNGAYNFTWSCAVNVIKVRSNKKPRSRRFDSSNKLYTVCDQV